MDQEDVRAKVGICTDKVGLSACSCAGWFVVKIAELQRWAISRQRWRWTSCFKEESLCVARVAVYPASRHQDLAKVCELHEVSATFMEIRAYIIHQ